MKPRVPRKIKKRAKKWLLTAINVKIKATRVHFMIRNVGTGKWKRWWLISSIRFDHLTLKPPCSATYVDANFKETP